MSVFFATARGKVRRNELADFVRVPSNGKIAMGLDDGDRLVGADVCDETNDILLASAAGKAIRFPVPSVRVFRSRTSEGVWGMDLAEGDEVMSMSVLRHVDLSIEDRDDFLRWSGARRRANGNGHANGNENGNGEEEEAIEPYEPRLPPERLAELEAMEELLLTMTAKGYGKRTSAFEYRITNRGGQGIINILTEGRNGGVVATFAVDDGDEVMLTTDGGQVIRIPVRDIRIAGRNTQGVRLFHTTDGETIVSAARLIDAEGANGQDEDEGEAQGPDAEA